EVLLGLREIGCSVVLASSPFSSHTAWDRTSREAVRRLEGVELRLYHSSEADFDFMVSRGRRCEGRKAEHPFRTLQEAPPGMRAWFSSLLSETAPDAVIITRSHWDGLLDHRQFSSLHRIMDSNDLITLNVRLQRAVKECLPGPAPQPDAVPDELLREDFYERRGLRAHPDEFRIFDQYQSTVAITPHEAAVIRQHTRKTGVSVIPATHEVCELPNNYAGPALLPTG